MKRPLPLILVCGLSAFVFAQAKPYAAPAGLPFPGVPLGASPVSALPVLEAALADRGPGRKKLRRDIPAIVDGDTLRVADSKTSLRLLGIDCEETFKSAADFAEASKDFAAYASSKGASAPSDRPPKYATPFGEAAKDFAQRFFAGIESVHLVYDDADRRIDGYGRLLVHVLVEKEGLLINFNVEVIRQGLSPYFIKYGRCATFDAQYQRAEDEARREHRGLWSERPSHACYPDYPVRLRFWADREATHREVERRAAADPGLLVLGRPEAWTKLSAASGQTVRIVGIPGAARSVREDLSLVPLPHADRLDLNIAGTPEAIERLGIGAFEERHAIVTGKVTIFRDRPQFRVEDIESIERVLVPTVPPNMGTEAPPAAPTLPTSPVR